MVLLSPSSPWLCLYLCFTDAASFMWECTHLYIHILPMISRKFQNLSCSTKSFLVFPFSPSRLTLPLSMWKSSLVFSELSRFSFLPLYFTYVYFLLDLFSTFYYLHCKFCKFLENKIQSDLSYHLHNG